MTEELQTATDSDYALVARAIEYLDTHSRRQPEVADVAAAVGLSVSHFHRVFRRWAGTTPKRFLQLLTLEEAKRRLDASRSVLASAYGAGLSGPGRLHDLFVSIEGRTPGEYRSGGAGVLVDYGVADTPFGRALIGRTTRGICHLSFHGSGQTDLEADVEAAMGELASEWPEAELRRDDAAAAEQAASIFAGERPPLHVRGTNFQVRVWEALLRVPEGRVVCYGDVARSMGRENATRAVAGAVAANHVAWLIPCHRVIRKVGEAGGYRWGTTRKRAMLGWEAGRAEGSRE